MKKVLAILTVIFISMVSFAFAPPKPPSNPTSTTDAKQSFGINRSEQGPIGTATALLLSMGAGVMAYKIRQNKKKETL